MTVPQVGPPPGKTARVCRRLRVCWAVLVSLVIVSACASGGFTAEAGPAGAPMVAFVGVNVVPMTPGASVVPNQTVLVREGRIAAVGPTNEVQVPSGALRIDAAGEYLMPGLADMHVHLEHFQHPDILRLFLVNGVTTVRNMDGRPYILEWREAVEEGELLGPSIYSAGPILDGDPPVRDDNAVVRNAEEAVAAVREQVEAGYDFIKVYTNLSPEAYRAVLKAAEEAGVPVVGHVPRRVSIEEALTGGQRAIEHLMDYGDLVEAEDSPVRDRWHWSKLYLAMPVDSDKMERAAMQIAEAGVWTVPTLMQANRVLAPLDSVQSWLAGSEMGYLPSEAPRIWEEQARRAVGRLDAEDWPVVARGRENRLRLLGALHRAGANLLVGTDTPNPFVIPGYSVHQELENFVAAGLTPREALSYATREAARFMGDLNEWGTVEVGKRADLLLLESNPLNGIRNARRPAGVMARGRWLPSERLPEMLQSLRH